MKKEITTPSGKIILGGAIVLFAIASACNMGADKEKSADNTTVMQQATDTNHTITATDTSMRHNDPMATAGTQSAAKTSATKKGTKGKVSVVLPVEDKTSPMNMDKEGYYTNTEVLPSFPGGQKALEEFFENNIEYPQAATESGVEGVVQINFVVDENGKVYMPHIVNPVIGYGLEEESIRVFKKMPVWNPGKIKGKNVKTRYTLPIRYQIS